MDCGRRRRRDPLPCPAPPGRSTDGRAVGRPTVGRERQARASPIAESPGAPRAPALRRGLSRIEPFDLPGEAGFDVEALVLQGRGDERRFDRPRLGRPRNRARCRVGGIALHRRPDPLKQEVGLRLRRPGSASSASAFFSRAQITGSSAETRLAPAPTRGSQTRQSGGSSRPSSTARVRRRADVADRDLGRLNWAGERTYAAGFRRVGLIAFGDYHSHIQNLWSVRIRIRPTFLYRRNSNGQSIRWTVATR